MKNKRLLNKFAVAGATLLYGVLCTNHPAIAELQQSQRSGAELQASFQYMLSDFSGPVASQWAKVDFDPEYQEIYTFSLQGNEVRIFNQQGMEIFTFGSDGEIAPAVDIAAGENGTIYALSRNFAKDGIQVLDYRGQLTSTIQINDPNQKLTGFAPNRLVFKAGKLYLLDSAALKIVSITTDGTELSSYSPREQLEASAKEQAEKKGETPGSKLTTTFDISGFCVADDGNIYFTIPTLFQAFRLDTAGNLDYFGTSGSGPGKFGVVSGIATDPQGHIYISDRLRSVVMIFDQQFTFLGEFGYRGDRPEDMIVPDDLAIDQVNQRVFVSQAANKGIGVYQISLSTTN